MDAFWLSLVMIFLAELGDKTQLVALTLATCYNTRVVLWGHFLGDACRACLFGGHWLVCRRTAAA